MRPRAERTGGDAAADWPEALGTAWCLTGEADAAQALAVAAVVRHGRRRRPEADVRRSVLRLAASPWWRWRRRPARPDADPFAAAYLALPLSARAVLVLRVADGLDAAAAASVLRLPRRRAEAATLAAVHALAGASPPSPPEADTAPEAFATGVPLLAPWPAGAVSTAELDLGEIAPGRVTGPDRPRPGRGVAGEELDPLASGNPVVVRLTGLFGALAATVPVVADPATLLMDGAERSRRQRRRSVAGAVVAAVVLGGSGVVIARQHAATVAAQARLERRRALDAVLHPVVTGTDPQTWPTRGNLRGRADLLARVRTVVAARTDTAVTSVPFLGEVGGLGVALAVTAPGPGGATGVVALTGPMTSAVSAWRVSGNDLESGQLAGLPVVAAALGTDDGRSIAVVVTVTSGVSVAWSERPDVDVAGALSRRYTALTVTNGVATAVGEGPASAALLRVERPGGAVVGAPQVVDDPPPPDAPLLRVVAPSCTGVTDRRLRANLADVARGAAAAVGRRADEVARVAATGCDQVRSHRVMFVGVTLTDGTALQTQLEQFLEVEGVGFATVGPRTAPRGSAASWPQVAPLRAVGDDPELRSQVVFCAPGAGTAELVRDDGTLLVRARLHGDGTGAAAAPVPIDVAESTGVLTVVVRDRRGHELRRAPYPFGAALPDLTTDGPVGPATDGPGFPHRR